LIDKFGNWQLPFLVSIVLLAIGVVLSFTMKPQNKFDYGKPAQDLTPEAPVAVVPSK
jgi:hypothetical protein